MERGDFLRYTHSIVRNKSYAILRKERKYAEIECGQEESIAGVSASVEDYVDLKIDAEKLSEIIERLDATEQRILCDKYTLEDAIRYNFLVK